MWRLPLSASQSHPALHTKVYKVSSHFVRCLPAWFHLLKLQHLMLVISVNGLPPY